MNSSGRIAALLCAALAGCEEGINNETVVLAATVRASSDSSRREGNSVSEVPSMSRDGRYVAFQSKASNLDPDDADALYDIYVKDLQTGALVLASRATSGSKGNGDSRNPSLSADGQKVAFESTSTNLDGADGDTSSDIYLRELVTQTTTLVSRATGQSGAKGSHGTAGYTSQRPSVSADGTLVAFLAVVDNFDAADTDAFLDVYVRQTASPFHTTLASRASGASGAKAGGACFSLSISGDGTWVAFDTIASNLGDGDSDATMDVFLRHLESPFETRLVSRADGASGVKSNGASGGPSVSSDGRYVVFASDGKNLVAGDSNEKTDVFLRDTATPTTVRVSMAASGAQAADLCDSASISDDGRFVAFSSPAVNLVSGDRNGVRDVFVRDLTGGTTLRVSVRTHGDEPHYPAPGFTYSQGSDLGNLNPRISGDGRFVAFDSEALDLVDGDTNVTRDAFAYGPMR